ncbi:MAG: SRPBCC family protein [Cyanobacteria bacterium J06632_22]
MLKKILGIVFGLVALLLIGGFVLPSQVHVERSLLVLAPAEAVFAQIGDFSRWQAWSPWAEMDPNMVTNVTGQGLGQTLTWHSEDPMVGDGTQTITALEAPNVLKTHLDFGPQGMADATFRLMPQADGTLVSWELDTDMRQGVPWVSQPLSTYFGFLMDQMIGADYEKGLQNLAQLLQRPS